MRKRLDLRLQPRGERIVRLALVSLGGVLLTVGVLLALEVDSGSFHFILLGLIALLIGGFSGPSWFSKLPGGPNSRQ